MGNQFFSNPARDLSPSSLGDIMKIVKLFLAALFLLVFTREGIAQCSLPECQEMLMQKSLPSESFRAPLGSLAFVAPQKKWQLQPELQVAQVNHDYNSCWLADLPSCHQFPALQFSESRTEISSRIRIYRERGLDSVTDEVTLGFHRRPKGFGLVWRRSF